MVRLDMSKITTKRAISYLASLRNVKIITLPPEDSAAATYKSSWWPGSSLPARCGGPH